MEKSKFYKILLTLIVLFVFQSACHANSSGNLMNEWKHIQFKQKMEAHAEMRKNGIAIYGPCAGQKIDECNEENNAYSY